MTREQQLGRKVALVLGLVAVVIVGGSFLVTARGLRFTAVFDDAAGLVKGDRVLLNGVDIGVVRGVELVSGDPDPRIEVEMRVAPEHADKVRSDVTAFIRSLAFPNVSGQMVVELIHPPGDRLAEPLPEGSYIQGHSSRIELEAWKLRQRVEDVRESWGEAAGELSESFVEMAGDLRELATDPELREQLRQLLAEATVALEDLSGFAVRVREQTGEIIREQSRGAYEKLQEDWPRVRDEVLPLARELRRFGLGDFANRIEGVVEIIEVMLARLERFMEPAPGDTPTTPPLAMEPPGA